MVTLLLVVWDKASGAELKRDLEGDGFEVILETDDGGRAVKAAGERQPAAAIIDFSSKPSHGLETARALRESKKTKEVPIVAMDVPQGTADRLRPYVPPAEWVEQGDVFARLRTMGLFDKL